MTSQAVELMWIRMGGSGFMAMEWPDLVSLFLRSKLDFLRKRGALHCSARSLLGIVPKTTYYS